MALALASPEAASCEPGVKAEPAEPEDKHTQRCDSKVVSRNGARLAVFAIFSDTRAQDSSTDEGDDTTYQVYNRRTGKIVESDTEGFHHETAFIAVHEPATTPGPVSGNGVNQYTDEDCVYKIHREFGTLGHGTGNNRCRSGAENRLEDEEALYGQTVVDNLVHHFKVEEVGSSYKSTDTKHESETDKPEEYRAKHEIDKVLHQNVCSILGAGKSGLNQGKTGLHKEHQHGSKQHPHGIERCSQLNNRERSLFGYFDNFYGFLSRNARREEC